MKKNRGIVLLFCKRYKEMYYCLFYFINMLWRLLDVYVMHVNKYIKSVSSYVFISVSRNLPTRKCFTILSSYTILTHLSEMVLSRNESNVSQSGYTFFFFFLIETFYRDIVIGLIQIIFTFYYPNLIQPVIIV